MTAKQIIDTYISFFEKKGHKRIPNAPLIPQNDPTTLFTSSGMQPLVPFLLGEPHPAGKRLVNVQNSFRAQDIDEVGDNRHTMFFRMLGNWSLGDYFKKEQLPWFFEFLTNELKIPVERLYVTVFSGYEQIEKDTQSAYIWQELFTDRGLNPKERIFYYDASKNWWSRAGLPQDMPPGEPGGPDSEVFYQFDFTHNPKYGKTCHPNCQCGRFMEIGNSVFMEFIKKENGTFSQLPQKNVDFGGGLERLLAAVENKQDIFETNLFKPIINTIETVTKKPYEKYKEQMRIITDHFVAATLIIAANVSPSNKEQGYMLRRLIRRGFDNYYKLDGKDIVPVLDSIINEYKQTDQSLVSFYEKIKLTILEEEQAYNRAIKGAQKFLAINISDYIKAGDELMGLKIIPAEIAFKSLASYGTSPAQLESLGYTIDDKQKFAELIKQHQQLSKLGAEQKFAGGLADHEEKTIMGHTATHLLHQALRDILGSHVHQTGSNITTERLRFDFNYDQKLTDEQIKQVENIINEKVKANLPISFEIMSQKEAEKLGAIGLFKETYGENVKIYFIGHTAEDAGNAYSIEYCGGPHVDFTGRLKSVKIIKQENIGHGQRRIYATVGV